MPTYVYECTKCGDEFEQWQSFSDDPLKKHPGCGGKVSKVLQPVGIVFKGSGFHKTDSRSGVKRSRGSDNGDGQSDGNGSKDTSSTDSSSDGKAEKKSDTKSDKKSETEKSDTKKSDTKKSEKATSSASSS
jgi:putative FmdB family regulatory protein